STIPQTFCLSCCFLIILSPFLFTPPATTAIYTLSLHDALPIYCYQYFCVPEYGTANGRLHFHAVHFMRTLPTGSVDPNFGQRYQIGRAVQQECRDRSRMPSSA